MSKTLALVSVISLVLCAAFFGLARMIGGDAAFHDSRAFAGIKPLIDLATHKEWRWDGGDSLAVNAPVNVVYHQGGTPRITVTGDAELLQHVKVGGGRIVSDTPPAKTAKAAPRLTAVISGMALRNFSVNGNEHLDLGEINQDELEIHVNGSGSISGTGHVKRLNLFVTGSGRADLGGLSAGDVMVRISGSGKTAIAPHDLLKLVLEGGSGRVFLASKPAKIEQTGSGSGGIVEAPGEMPAPSSNMPPPPPMPPNNGEVRNYLVKGQDVDLGHLDQKTLHLTIPGSGKVRAEGKVEELTVTIFGSGKAELGKLAAGDVKVSIFGSGDAYIAPSGAVNVAIKGSGTVHLRTRPKSVRQSLLGSGRVLEEY